MSLPSLFVTEAQLEDVSTTKLPQDMDAWAETIVSKIREKLPHTKETSVNINFTKKDEETGTAIGAAAIFNQKINKTIYIPLIIKGFKLSPIDVMIAPTPKGDQDFETTALTKDHYDIAMMSNSVFNHLGKPFDRLHKFYADTQSSIINPPHVRNKYASVLEEIKETIYDSDRQDFITGIRKNPEFLVGYEKRANLKVLENITKSTTTKVASKRGLENVSLIKKDLGGKYNVITTSDEAYAPIIKSLTNQDLRETLVESMENPADALHEVERNGEKLILKELRGSSPQVCYPGAENYQSVQEVPTKVKTFGIYKVQDKNAVFHKGVVLPNVIDFSMKVLPSKVFLSPKKAGYQTKISGIPVEGEKIEDYLPKMVPQVGVTGVFVIRNETNALSTIPVTIRSLREVHGQLHMIVMDINGKTFKIKHLSFSDLADKDGLCSDYTGERDIDKAVKEEKEKNKDFSFAAELQKIVKVKDYYLMPVGFKFYALNNFCELSEDVKQVLEKSAAAYRDANPVRVIHTGASQFSLKGPDMQKMASAAGWDCTNLSGHQAVFLLAAKRCNLEKIAQALKIAGTYGESTIHHLPKIQEKPMTKTASTTGRNLRVNLYKEASQLDESQVVDATLSLNFINPENIQKFTSYIPLFESCVTYLAHALLASRLGMASIPEQATSSAMMRMVEVIKGLKRLAIEQE